MSKRLPLAKPLTHTPSTRVKYSKLARPLVHEALPRHRLFALLDSKRQKHAVLWIASPPGAGKTTLAASYLASSALNSIWYQVDQSDNDPATLFFFLSEAIRESHRSMQPWQAGDMAKETTSVERLFFRDFYTRLVNGTVVVLDNIHEFDWNNSGELLECAFDEIPYGITVLAISRDSPPARLARMELNGRLTTIGWNDLRLDDDEANALINPKDVANPNNRAWLNLVDGWAAGVVMLRNLSQHADQFTAPLSEGREAVFRYFAGEILERMPQKSQHLLLLLSCLPSISADDAEKLTGDPAASQLLRELYHNRLFIERSGTESFNYHFHALFREFLQREAHHRLDTDARVALLKRAGAILDKQGRVDEAAQLYQDAEAHFLLVDLLVRRAANFLAAGRGQTWREWMSCLPAEIVDAAPELWYWHGVSLNQVAPVRARQILIRAAQAFEKVNNTRAVLLAICAIIDSYDLEWADLSTLPDWIEKIRDGLNSLGAEPSDLEFELKLYSRLTNALLLAAPESPLLRPAAERALQTLPQIENPLEQLAAGAILLRYFDYMDDADIANRLVVELSKLADDPAISPFHRVLWYRRVAHWHNKDGKFQEAQQITGAAKLIVTNFDLNPLLFQFLEIHHLLGAGDLAAARTLLDQVKLSLSPTQKLDLAEWHSLDSNWRSLSGDINGAIEVALRSVQLGDNAALPASERSRLESFLGACYALTGNFAESNARYEKAKEYAHGYDVRLTEEAKRFVEAYACSVRGDDTRATDMLRELIAGHLHRQATTFFVMVPRLASEICALALRDNIEVEHTRGIIRRQQLTAPNRFISNWPWPVAIRTLGTFELLFDGKITTSTGKTQQRPLLLLKVLVAAGRSGKTQQSIATQLWPEADDAKAALNVTVHRLRKLLNSDAAVIVASGHVRLAEVNIWTDIAAFSDVCDEIENLFPDASTSEVSRQAARLLSLYQGPFCDGEEDSWMLTVRNRWCNRFLSAVSRLGHYLEESKEWSLASTLYHRALEAESLTETNYRGLMRCAHAQSDRAAAYGAYRRCRHTLSVMLGHQPSAETEKLAISLGLKE
jgi:ATP/maltotriose-dependent transcriptional regulator MalT/DNA-binding SARP family transcriptional activator